MFWSNTIAGAVLVLLGRLAWPPRAEPPADRMRAGPGPPAPGARTPPRRRAAIQEYAMSLSYSQQRQLRLIGAGLRRSDPHVGAMFGIFGRLYPCQDLPDTEQLPDGALQGRLRRAAAWIVAAFAVMAVAITVLLGKAVTRPLPDAAPAPERRRPARTCPPRARGAGLR